MERKEVVNEVIRLCEQIGGRPFAVERVPIEALQAQLAGAMDEDDQAFAGLMLFMAQGEREPIEMMPALQAIPLRMVSVRDYVRRMLSMPIQTGPVAR